MTNTVNLSKAWVSFCMSTYMRPHLLEKTLSSILSQTFKDFEIVISDNDPAASARPVVEKFNDPRIKYYNNGTNLGMIKSFNKSIERAGTEYIVMITDDDPVYPEMLQTLFDLYTEKPGYGVYHGGCDIVYTTPFLANMYSSKVGTNSCLNFEKPLGEISTYSAEEFPHAFFTSKVTTYMLWSVGAVKKSILMDVGGIPDYGSPYLGDICYTALICSHSGVAVINKALGCQIVHGKNFGHTELENYEILYKTPGGFYNWIFERMGSRKDWKEIEVKMNNFIGRSMAGFCLVNHKYLTAQKIPDTEFKKVTRKIFKIPGLKKWKYKYYLSYHFPFLYKFLLELKSRYFN